MQDQEQKLVDIKDPSNGLQEKVKNLDLSSLDEQEFKKLLNEPKSISDLVSSLSDSLTNNLDSIKDQQSLDALKKVYAWIEAATTEQLKKDPSCFAAYTKFTPDKGLIHDFIPLIQDKINKSQISPNVSKIIIDLKSQFSSDTMKDYLNKLSDNSIDAKTRDEFATYILDQVIDSKNVDMVNKYLTYISPTSLIYLGVSPLVQKQNYNKLINSSFKDNFNEEQKKILVNVLGALNQQPNLLDGIKTSMDTMIKQFGGLVLNVIELFGGRGALKNFCTALKVDYYKYFDGIDKLYKDTYQLTPEQTKALDDVYSIVQKDESFKSSEDDLKLNRDKAKDFYEKQWSSPEKFELLDPILVDKAAKKLNLVIPNLIVENGQQYGQKLYKINKEADIQDEDRKNIIKTILEDPSLWFKLKPILRSNTIGDSIYGKPDKGYSSRWALIKKPQDAHDSMVAMGVYLMSGSKDLKYMFSENTMPYEASHKKETGDEAIAINWKSKFQTYTSQYKDFFTNPDQSKFTLAQKQTFETYKTELKTDCDKLLSPNSKEFLALFNEPGIRLELKLFLLNNLSTYLTITKSKFTEDSSKKKIDATLNTISQMTAFLKKSSSNTVSFEFNDNTGFELFATIDNKTVKISNNDFFWLQDKSNPTTSSSTNSVEKPE